MIGLITTNPASASPDARDSVPAQTTAPQSPFVQLLAEQLDDNAFTRAYRAPSLAGRSRPIGGLQEDVDPFAVHYTARTSHAIPLGASAVGV